MPIPDEEFLAVSIDAKIDYHQTVDLGKAKMSVTFMCIYWLEIIIVAVMFVCHSVLCVVLFIMFCISLTDFPVVTFIGRVLQDREALLPHG